MKVLYGRNIPKSYYPKIVALDGEIFSDGAEDFVGDTTMSEEAVMSMLEKNIDTTVIVVDDNGEVIGYYQTFPMEPEFESRYIRGETDFKELDGTKVMAPGSEKINLYLWSIGIKEEYRGVKFLHPDDPTRVITVNGLLHEGLVDALADVIASGTQIDMVYGEGVSEKGVKEVIAFCGEDSLIHANEEDEFYLYGAKFDPHCKALSRCQNIGKLVELEDYDDYELE